MKIVAAPRPKFIHWAGPNGVTCRKALDEPVIISSTDTHEVSCNACQKGIPKEKEPCSSCNGTGGATDAPQSSNGLEACWDCEGSGVESEPVEAYYDDDSF